MGTNAVGATVTELLTTSDQAFSKTAGLEIETYDKEDGDVDGPFALAVSIEDASGGQLAWFAPPASWTTSTTPTPPAPTSIW